MAVLDGRDAHRLEEVHFQLERGVAEPGAQPAVDRASHRAVEHGRHDPAVDGAERVVVELGRLERERHEALAHLVDLESE